MTVWSCLLNFNVSIISVYQQDCMFANYYKHVWHERLKNLSLLWSKCCFFSPQHKHKDRWMSHTRASRGCTSTPLHFWWLVYSWWANRLDSPRGTHKLITSITTLSSYAKSFKMKCVFCLNGKYCNGIYKHENEFCIGFMCRTMLLYMWSNNHDRS